MPPSASGPVAIDPAALTAIRTLAGHSLSSLARAAGYSVGYINDLEKGRRRGNAAVIAALAGTLRVPNTSLTLRQDAAA